MLRVQEIKDIVNLAYYRDDWTRLLAACPDGDLFQTFEWVSTWIEEFWRHGPIRFLLVWNGTQLAGLAPFLLDDTGELWCSPALVLPINPHARRTGILHDGRVEEVVNAILRYLRTTGSLVKLILPHVVERSGLAKVMAEAARGTGMSTVIKADGGSPIVLIREDWESYLLTRSDHFRSGLGRKRRKLERAGRAKFVIADAPEALDRALNAVLHVERNSWKQTAGTSFTAERGLARFYHRLARRCAQQGWLRVYLLYVDGQPIAHIYGTAYRNRYYALKTAYDRSYAAYSPGAVLFGFALRDAFAQQYEMFDFLGYQSRWKNEMANDVTRHVDLCVFSRGSLRCTWCRLCEHYMKPLVKTHLPVALVVNRMCSPARSDRGGQRG